MLGSNPHLLLRLMPTVRACLCCLALCGPGPQLATGDEPAAELGVTVETPYLGVNFDSDGDGVRFFLAEIKLSNSTADKVSLSREAVSLWVDGVGYPLKDVPPVVQNQTIRIGQKGYIVKDLQTPEQISVPAGETEHVWVVFSGLPLDSEIPELELQLRLGEHTRRIHVNKVSDERLKLKVERIGPRGCLGLLTVDGTLDTVNFGRLMAEIRGLVDERVLHVVLAFGEKADSFEPRLAGWLQQSAARIGREEIPANNIFPTFPVTLREFHLAALPGRKEDEAGNEVPTVSNLLSSRRRIHASKTGAVIAALEQVYKALPREELLQQFEGGHRLSRVAALAYGGGRLDVPHLPLLLEYTDDKDALVQSAALSALRDFGEASAVEKLSFHARQSAEPARSAAIESLAASRYAAAHEALLTLMQTQPVEFQTRAVEILGRHPRPLWSDAIYRVVTGSDPGPTPSGLEALVRVGHPQLLRVLEESLSHPEPEVQAAALRLLTGRRDRASDLVASRYVLKRLQEAPPTLQILELLKQTKDPRAIPALTRHFEEASSDRGALIECLALVGDLSVCEVFVREYPELGAAEKAGVLTALQQLRATQFYDLAEAALLVDEQTLIRSATQNLQADGSPEAVRRLGQALEKTSQQTTWAQVCNALAVIATPQARDILRKARGVDDKTRRGYVVNALRFLQQRSPGFQYVYQAQQSFREEKWQEADTQFTLALQMDPELPDAYTGRGNARVELKQLEQACADFRKAYEIDPEHPQSITGLALALVFEGKFDQAFKTMEDGHRDVSQPETEVLYAYNSACVFARAVDRVREQPESLERAKKLAEFETQALKLLETSVRKGFNDFDWMKKDPDLRALHSLPDFQRISTPGRVQPDARLE